MKTRVKRLEEKSGGGFRVVVPARIRWDGEKEELENKLGNEEVGAIAFDDLEVQRLEDEEYEDFCSRAHQLARTSFPYGTIVLPECVIFL